jgi:hypothetical protein
MEIKKILQEQKKQEEKLYNEAYEKLKSENQHIKNEEM